MSVDTVPPGAEVVGFPPLAEKLEHFVYDRTNGMLRNLRVTIHDDEIELSGSASSYYAKQLATHAIYEAIPGAKLNNRIRVS